MADVVGGALNAAVATLSSSGKTWIDSGFQEHQTEEFALRVGAVGVGRREISEVFVSS